MLTIVSKTEPSALKGNLMRIAAVIIALAASAIVMAFMGYNPFVIYGKIIEGSLMSAYRLTETINKTIPLTVKMPGSLWQESAPRKTASDNMRMRRFIY